MATWKAYRVSDIISEISDGRFVLPVIQRRFVWDEEKVELLFDTLLKGDSFGGIIVIEEEKNTKPLFSYRAFSKDGEPLASIQVNNLAQVHNFVIDGQQRLQSFYIGIKGTLNGKVLYFDLYSEFNTEYEFKFENDVNKLSKFSKDEREIKEHNWYIVSSLFQRLKDTNDDDQVADEIIKNQNIIDNTKIKYIARNIKAFYKNLITAETLGISKVSINKTFDESVNRQKIVELFKRLNDGGTKLSTFDLVASKLKGFSWEMEAFLDKVLLDYNEIGLSQDNLLKLIFLIQDNYKKEMASIEEADAKFTINNKERIQAVLKALKDFLIHSKLLNYYKGENRSFIPLFFISYHLFHKNISNKDIISYFDNFDSGNIDFPKIKSWIYHSLINGVFRSKGAGWIPYKTGVKKILEELSKYKNTPFPVDKLFDLYTNHPIAFTKIYTVSDLDNFDTGFLYYIIYDNSLTIRIQDIDHIMPKSILGNLNYDSYKINSIKNFQLIDYGTNRGEKNGKPFRQWIDKFVTDKDEFIKRHLIPDNKTLWDEDKFEDFIAERGKLIIKKIESIL